jgi:2-amino-4-hydroxy-6-hydroxymethyldihydropteridine diphosphokinase
MTMNKAYLLIGGNMGNREGLLAAAREQVAENCGTLYQQSALYQTAPWGLEEQPPFLNQALEVHTPLPATELLKTVLSIEEVLGRKRTVKYGPREVDIDILLFGDAVVNEANLLVPHPQLANRRFALVPLAEIAPNHIHPLLQKTISRLLAECSDQLDVHKIS